MDTYRDKGTFPQVYEAVYTPDTSSGVPPSSWNSFPTYPINRRVGVMIVGLGGNNGSTMVASLLAYKNSVSWETKDGTETLKFYGSQSQYGAMTSIQEAGVNVPMKSYLKNVVCQPENIVVGGWDICGDTLYQCCVKNKVIPYDLRERLRESLESITPLKGIFDPGYYASNQALKANHVEALKKNRDRIEYVKECIAQFRKEHSLGKVVVLWSASTESAFVEEGEYHKTVHSLVDSEQSLPPSWIYALGALEGGDIFLNGSPQNTLDPRIIDSARANGGYVAGNDFKTGQTRLKSVLVDYLTLSGLRPTSIASYNHLGNNDGLNLSERPQFLSKKHSKKGVIADVVKKNPHIYEGKEPDHCVVIEYMPSVGDSKRAMDEYVSMLMMGGDNIMSIYNLCEDSLLAVPVMLDLVVFSDLFSRSTLEPVLSDLAYFFKAPVVEEGEEVVNTFYAQRDILEMAIIASVDLLS
jgi:myo-inositol-1-phosphate synthase